MAEGIATAAGELLNAVEQVQAPAEEVVSVAEVAKRLGKSTKTVLRYCKAGTLKPFTAPGARKTTGVYASSLANLGLN